MQNDFSINAIFEPELNVTFNVIDGTFTTNNQSYIITHQTGIQMIKQLNSWEHIVYGEDENNYFEIQYRWSTDNSNWSNWYTLDDIFSDFTTDNLIWLQFQYTFISDETKEIELKQLKLTGDRIIDDIFQPVTFEPNKPVVYTNQDTYKVFSTHDFKLYMAQGNESDLQIKYRYTQTQGRRWTDWKDLTSDNLQSERYERIKFANFQFGFINTGTTDISLFDLELIGEFQNVTANNQTIAKFGLKSQCNPLVIKPAPDSCEPSDDVEKCCLPCSDALTPWNDNIDECDLKSNVVNLNDRNIWTRRIRLNEQLNEFIQQRNSWKVQYLLTDPDRKGIDHILHEQQIHNVIAMKDINIIVPDNQFPVDTLIMNGMNLDMLQTFEIHILKNQFKKVFGVEFRPSKRDVIYFCDANQLWEVEMMFPHKGFQLAEFYYRVMLKKYNKNKARQYAQTTDGQNAFNFVDNLTKHTTLDSMFELNETDDIKQNVKDNNINFKDTSDQHTNTTEMDIRLGVNDKVEIIEEDIMNATVTFSKSHYKLPIKSKNLELVKYNVTDQMVDANNNRAFSMWFKTDEYNTQYKYVLLSNFDEDNNIGYKIELYNGYLTLYYNNNTYDLPIAQYLQNDTWYAILINYDQIKKNTQLSVYRRQNELGHLSNDTKLILVQKTQFDIIPENMQHDKNLFIGGVDTFNINGNRNNWYLTNIRIYTQVISTKQRNIMLNERIVKDSHLIKLVDNCEKYLQLPNYGNI